MDAVTLLYEWLAGIRQRGGHSSTASITKARAIVRSECRRWLDHNAVVGFGIGEKFVMGRTTKLPALQVFVRRKLPLARVRPTAIPTVMRLPHSGELVLLDVIERGSGVPHGAVRCASDGIRREFPGTGPGTLGCFLRSANPSSTQRYALTCWHVAADAGGLTGAIVGWCDDAEGLLPNARIGTLDRYVSADSAPGTAVVRDAALVRIDDGYDLSNSNRVGREINGIRADGVSIDENLTVFGFGSKKSRTGRVSNPRTTITVDYSDVGEIKFTDAILCEPCSGKGDSGAIALDSNGMGVGMVVGGEDRDGGWTGLVPLQNILSYFNARLLNTSTSQTYSQASPRLPKAKDVKTAIDTLARTMWGEAEGEPTIGKVAVANVIVNRTLAGRPKAYGGTIEAVCQKNNGSVWQFSCWAPSEPRSAKCKSVSQSNLAFTECLDIAGKAVAGKLEDNTVGSLNYHATSVKPAWAAGHTPIVTIGHHMFYNDIP